MCCSVQAFVIGLAFKNYVQLLTVFHFYALHHFVPKYDLPTVQKEGGKNQAKDLGFLQCLLCY